jgi:hypothetical protein
MIKSFVDFMKDQMSKEDELDQQRADDNGMAQAPEKEEDDKLEVEQEQDTEEEEGNEEDV